MKLFLFAILFILIGLGNFLVLQRFYNLITPSIYSKIFLVFIAILFTFSLLIVILWGDDFPFPLTSFLAKLGGSWLFILLYALILLGVQEILLFLYKIQLLPSSSLKFIARDSSYATIGIILLLIIVFFAGFFNYKDKRRVHIDLEFYKKTNTETDNIYIKKIKIVALSDLHLGYTIHEDELADWVTKVNKEKPEVILLVGDIIDSSLKAVNRLEIIKQLKRLKAKHGVYAVLGNHEYIASKGGDISSVLKFFGDANIKLLRDEVVEIDNSYYIIGRDDKTNTRRKSLKDLTENLDKQKSTILLDHQPFHLEETEACQIDLQLSGHTHQGQLWPISIITNKIFENDHGLLKKGKSNIYVSSGIGIWGGKFRLGTNSEFVVIDIIQCK